MKFVKGEIICSSFDPRFIGVFEYSDKIDNYMSCFINVSGEFTNRLGNFSGFQKATKEQKEYFKKVLLKHGYSYYKCKVIKEL